MFVNACGVTVLCGQMTLNYIVPHYVRFTKVDYLYQVAFVFAWIRSLEANIRISTDIDRCSNN